MDASVRDAFPNENTPLGPFLGNLPVDVLRVVLGLLTPFERALFARAGSVLQGGQAERPRASGRVLA